MVKGCDVSKYQGIVDWKTKALAGFNFAYAKATEGASIVDSQFHRNKTAIAEAGLLGGAYHFFHPSVDPVAQAKHFCDTVGKSSGLKLPPMFDWEMSDHMRVGDQINHARICLDYIAQYFGKAPFIYSYLAYFHQLNLPLEFAKYPLWLAAYTAVMPHAPAPFHIVSVWQSSGSNGLDIDWFNGEMSQLEKFAN